MSLRDYDGVSILVTHDRDEAYQLCDSLLLLDREGCWLAGRPGTYSSARSRARPPGSRAARTFQDRTSGARRIKAVGLGAAGALNGPMDGWFHHSGGIRA